MTETILVVSTPLIALIACAIICAATSHLSESQIAESEKPRSKRLSPLNEKTASALDKPEI